MTYTECIPFINQLNHRDKLRLAQWLIMQIAADEGIYDDRLIELTEKNSGLCGVWNDSRSSKEIADQILGSRTVSKDVLL